jgi:flagellar M-ring protein FliF
LKTFIEQLGNRWNQTSKPGRLLLVVASILCVAMIVAVGVWSSRPQYVALASSLSPAEAAEIVTKLDAEGIAHQLNFAGSSVLVPKSQWNRARLVAGDRFGGAPAASEELDDSFMSDPTTTRFKILRHREQTLARSIMRMDAIASATVHIGVGRQSPFTRDRKPATASVVLELRPNAVFTRENAAAVVAMVGGSVEGLDPSNVTVMDTSGRILSFNTTAADSEINGQLEYRRKLEADLAAKAELMLAEMLGAGRAIVRVTADIDFTQTERTETSFDPDRKVKLKEIIESDSTTGSGTGVAGAAGTASNLAARRPATGGGQKSMTREKTETDYENAKTVDTTKQAGGTIQRLTIAAMVDLETEESEDQPRNVSQEQIQSIIKQAVGFDDTRNDQIEVLMTQLASAQELEDDKLDEAQQWQFYSTVARQSSLGLAAVVALIVGLMVLKKIRPVGIPSGPAHATGTDRARVLSQLSEQARENPELMANVMSAWLGDEPQGPADAAGAAGQQRARAA